MIKVGSELIWLDWVAIIEPKDKEILSITMPKERNMFVAQRFLSKIIKDYDKHPVLTDGGTWYPQSCMFLKVVEHRLYSSYQKSKIERTMQYIKDRTESFDDYFPFRKKKCKLKHVMNWFNLFITHYNKEII